MTKRLLKQFARPFRELLGRAIIIPPSRQLPIDWVANMGLMTKVAHFIASNKVDGDYLEFGVFRGNSFVESYRSIKRTFEERIQSRSMEQNVTDEDARDRKRIWDNMRFFAFDSFKGLPELRGVDLQTNEFAEGQYAAGIDEFLRNVTSGGVPSEKIVCVPGWYEETCIPVTLEKHGLKKASVVWVDCDLYHSAKRVLHFVTPLLQDGTIIIFDDWYNYRGSPWRGEQRAFAEWRAADLQGFTLSEYQKQGPWQNSFVVSKIPA